MQSDSMHKHGPSKDQSTMSDNVNMSYDERKISESATLREQLLEVQSKPIYDCFDPDSPTTITQDSNGDSEAVVREMEKSSK